ncbi:hypothetical protein [Speluncibacter jeojiensis]|uniref:Uncharacterized protein n=1 Tax=Speluncibacter jeojiensis TaxID=2710754 RepID=A0A9X4M1S8_9ACTN|nr:hypothetical protein [Corynebacteriales bacterium D3-21]
MGENFAAKPAEIGGMGGLAQTSADHLTKLEGLLHEASPSTGYDGLMEFLKAPVSECTAATVARVQARQSVTLAMAAELKRSAWLFSATDHGNAEALARAHTHTEVVNTATACTLATTYDVVPGVEQYPATGEPDLSVPEHKGADIRGMIDSTTGVLKDIDAAIQTVTNWVSGSAWSPTAQIVKPLSGNWTELERAGAIYSQAGGGCETVGRNLRDGARRLDASWDGRSAIAYQGYVAHLIKALEWEAPSGRLAERVLAATSEQIQKSAKALLQKVNDVIQEKIIGAGLKDVFVKAATKVLPGQWIYMAWEIGEAIVELWQEATKVVDTVKTLINDAKAVIEAIEDPVNFAEDKAEAAIKDKLEPITNAVHEARDDAKFAADLTSVADTSAVTGAPSIDFSVGSGDTPWQSAS